MKFEFSAGGLVVKDNKILIVKVETLKKEIVWTFPKGHIEKGEKGLHSALREVEEETGWRCKLVESYPFEEVKYWFKREGELVKKSVKWFLMKPINEVRKYDKEEIIEYKWIDINEAEKILVYPSDKKLIKKLKQHYGI